MKLKKINIIEQHIEKLIALIVLGGSGWLLFNYVLGGPYNVKAKGGDTILEPSEVENSLVKLSEVVGQKIDDKADSPLPDLSIPKYSEIFQDRLATEILKDDEYVSPLSWPGVSEIKVTQRDVARTPSELPNPPKLTNVTMSYGHFLLVTEDYDTYAGLSSAPRDIWAVSVSAEFPTSEWQTKLEENFKVGIDLLDSVKVFVDVKVHRQIKHKGQFGSFVNGVFEEGSFEVLPAMPGTPDNTEYMERERWIQDDGKAYLSKLRNPGEQEKILRPDFPILDQAGPQWVAPEGYVEVQTETDTKVQISETGKVLLQPIRLIGHDILLKPGNTYRYRLALSVLNPAFQAMNITNISDATKQQLALIAKDPCPWTEAVTIPDSQYVFVSKTTANNATVELWHMFGGKWVATELEIEPGQTISGKVDVISDRFSRTMEMHTDLLLVDLLPLPSAGIRGPEYKAVLLNKKTGRIEFKTPRVERKHPLRELLENSDYKEITAFQ